MTVHIKDPITDSSAWVIEGISGDNTKALTVEEQITVFKDEPVTINVFHEPSEAERRILDYVKGIWSPNLQILLHSFGTSVFVESPELVGELALVSDDDYLYIGKIVNEENGSEGEAEAILLARISSAGFIIETETGYITSFSFREAMAQFIQMIDDGRRQVRELDKRLITIWNAIPLETAQALRRITNNSTYH